MPTALLGVLFCASLAITLVAARTFAERLDEVAVRLGLPEALIGLLTALAADGPEIVSALVALIAGARAASLGVVAGSNVFNLAAMIGLSALVAGSVRLRRAALAFEGTVASLTMLLVAALVVGLLSPLATALLLAGVLVPYVLLLLMGAERLRIPAPAPRRRSST
jgi:cation:H+ antiporter